MAKAINLRTRLSLPNLRATSDVADLARQVSDMQRNLLRWSDALPFGSAGFRVRRSNSQAAIAHLATANIGFNVMVSDEEGWAGIAAAGTAQTRFYCPPGLSGWYYVTTGLLFEAAKSNVYLAIRHLNLAGTATPVTQERFVSTDRQVVSACIPLQDGESVDVYMLNWSGANITPTYFAADTINPYWPYLTCHRVSLL